MSRTTCLLSCLVLLAGCQRQSPPASPARMPPVAAPQATPTQPPLKDVSERTPRYMIGISYPEGIDKYPGLAAAMADYSHTAQAELMRAVAGMGSQKPTVPYDLSLSFTKRAETPQLVVVSADGSTYTGGAHGTPLVARFNWMPRQQQMLTSSRLFADPAAWSEVAAYARDQLLASLSQRLDADDLPPGGSGRDHAQQQPDDR